MPLQLTERRSLGVRANEHVIKTSGSSWNLGLCVRVCIADGACRAVSCRDRTGHRKLWLPSAKDPCNDCPGHSRVCVTIPLGRVLFDQLMNGPMGYRAHYALSIEAGEAFNRELVSGVVPQLVKAEHLYCDLFSVAHCADSLSGPYSKLWFPKQFTDPSVPFDYANWPEVISIPSRCAHWRELPKPRKGLWLQFRKTRPFCSTARSSPRALTHMSRSHFDRVNCTNQGGPDEWHA